MNPFRAPELGGSELALRVCSALVLAPVAIATAYIGSWWFAGLWGIAALGMFWEWTSLVSRSRRPTVLIVGALSLLCSVVLATEGNVIASLMALATGSFAAAGIAPAQSRSWLAASVPYCGSVAVAPIMLRSDAEYGFAAMIFLFAIVWGTDIIAYFVGKLVGGPRPLPQEAPKRPGPEQ